MCEMVMARDDIPKDLQNNGALYTYPGIEDSDEEDLDALADSYDIQMGKDTIILQMFLCRFESILFCMHLCIRILYIHINSLYINRHGI
jgi:hypothetical protein